MTAQIESGISVQAENRPGFLARISNTFAQEGLNIEGFSAPAEQEKGRVFFFVDDSETALNTLNNQFDFNVREEEFVFVDAPNQVGELARFTKPLSERNIDIDSSFLTFKDDQPRIAFQTSANKRALNLFRELQS